MYLAYYTITNTTPWEDEYQTLPQKNYLSYKEQSNSYKNLRRENHAKYVRNITEYFNVLLQYEPNQRKHNQVFN